MRRNPLLLGDRIKRMLNRDAVLVTHGLIGLIVFVETSISDSISNTQRVAIYALLAIITILGIARLLNFKDINNRPALHLSLYHLLLSIGIIFFAPIGSNYVFVWLVLLFLTNFFFGIKLAFASGMILAVTLELQLLWSSVRLDNGITGSDIATILTQLVIIFTVAIFFVNTQSVSDQDRHLLVASMDKAQLERQRLISLINSMVDAVVATDDQGQVKLYNAAALNILDTNEDLTGKPIGNFLRLYTTQGNRAHVSDLSSPTSTTSFHSRDYLIGEADEKINISLSISPIKLGFRRDSERGYIITFRDITREKSLEEERDEFISVISHELRTPVAITEASISNALFMVENKNEAEPVLTSLKEAHKQALFLAGMLNDLSTLSRAEKGKLEHSFEAFDPRELVDELFVEYLPQAETKGLEFNKKLESPGPQSITSNRLYVKEILQNFLTNAIKYTREGSITLQFEEYEDDAIKLSVIDTGIGISKSDQKKIFNKFYRSEDYRTRESNGTGLGLYITKKLAAILSARFEVHSKLNEGSTFSIIIPDQQITSPTDAKQ